MFPFYPAGYFFPYFALPALNDTTFPLLSFLVPLLGFGLFSAGGVFVFFFTISRFAFVAVIFTPFSIGVVAAKLSASPLLLKPL